MTFARHPIALLLAAMLSQLVIGKVSDAAEVKPVCQAQQVQLQVLGSGGPELTDGRASTSYLIWVDKKARILVDFGSGAALNYEKARANPADLQAVLFSHFHVDHTADFPALVKGLGFTKFNDEIQVYGPTKNNGFPGVKEFLSALFDREHGAYAYLANATDPDASNQFKIEANEVPPTEGQVVRFELGDDTVLKAISIPHGAAPSLAWRVETRGCALTFSGDTSNSNKALEVLANGSDLFLAHNAAQENDSDAVARELHMMPSEIGRIAKAATVKQVVLSHRMLRTLGKEKETLQAIRKNYAGSVQFANDLQVFRLGDAVKH
ncbi:MAG: MBL fold metallo-hydrolase [Burkholderiaceae bacterium]|nr:MBL fold metallo-hydrolase [Burkholderiaceae bacterium]